MALSRGLRLHQYLDDWLIRSQSQEEARVNTRAVVDITQRSRIEGGLPGLSKLQGPVPEPNSASCNSGSLHKQTRRNSLSRDMRSPVEDHDMVPSLSHNNKSQTHSRVSQCDARPSFQVKPSTVDRMVTASPGVQTDLL